MGNPQSDESENARQITAYTLELYVGGKLAQINPPDGVASGEARITLPISPQHTSMGEPMRVGVEQTQTGFYLNEWGFGLKPITLGGHTGFATRSMVPDQDGIDGYQAFLVLRSMFRRYGNAAKANANSKTASQKPVEMRLHMWEEDEHWQVVPNGAEAFRSERNEQAPLLFNYSMSFLGVKDLAGTPDTDVLGLDLFGLPGLGDIAAGVTEGLAFFDALSTQANKFASDLNGFTSDIKRVTRYLHNVTKSLNAVVRRATNAVAPAIAAFRQASAAVKQLRKAIVAVQMPFARLLDLSRGLVKLFCTLRHGEIFLTNLFPLGGAWDALSRQVSRC